VTIESHPYGDFIPKKAQGMIIGSFPIGKFTNPKRSHEIKSNEFNFFFGGEKNLLWKLLAHARKKELHQVSDIIQMLEELGVGIGDVIKSCRRKNGGASDSDLYQIEFNHELLQKIRRNKIKTLYFTSRKVETWFNQMFPETDDLKKISLISPSAQTLRSLVKNPIYLKWKLKHPFKKPLDFLFADYKRVFSRLNRK
jgi:G:T/U-mismatch repair DNA glycosylase